MSWVVASRKTPTVMQCPRNWGVPDSCCYKFDGPRCAMEIMNVDDIRFYSTKNAIKLPAKFLESKKLGQIGIAGKLEKLAEK